MPERGTHILGLSENISTRSEAHRHKEEVKHTNMKPVRFTDMRPE